MGRYKDSVDFIDRSNRRARKEFYSLNLDEALRPYAEGARARETEKPMCITCGKEKTITNDFAICWDCVQATRGGDMNE